MTQTSHRIFTKWYILALAALLLNGIFLFLNASRGGITNENCLVTIVEPAGGKVSHNKAILFRFDSDMVSADTIGESGAESILSFSPGIHGAYTWLDKHQLRFQPEENWQKATTYEIKLTPGLESAAGHMVTFSDEPTIQTPSLTVENIGQLSYVRNKTAHIQLTFNDQVSPDECRKHLDVRDSEQQKVEYRFVSDKASERLTLQLKSLTSDSVDLMIKQGLKGLSGENGLEHAHSTHLVFTGDLKLRDIRTHVSGPSRTMVYFESNFRLDVESAQAALSFTPEVAHVRVEHRYGNRYMVNGQFSPGATYMMAFSDLLRGSNGNGLSEEFSRRIRFKQSDPEITLQQSGNYLSPKGPMTIPYESINISKIKADVFRVYENNLVYLTKRQKDDYRWRKGYQGQWLSKQVGSLEEEIHTAENEVHKGRLDLRDIIDGQAGAYFVRFSSPGVIDRPENQFLVISDIALTCKILNRQLLVWANSLRSGEAVSGAIIRVYSNENQLIAEAESDRNGVALVTLDVEADVDPHLITASTGNDLTFLALDDMKISLPGNQGDTAFRHDGYEGYVFPDRDMVRPGEKAYVRAIVRDIAGQPANGFPVECHLIQPDGKTVSKQKQILSEYGSAVFDVEWPEYAPLGRYKAEIRIPGASSAIGMTSIKVEEFVPARIKVLASAPSTRWLKGEQLKFDVSAHYLFGAVAKDMKSRAWVVFSAEPFSHAKWKDYHFGYTEKPFGPVTQELGDRSLNEHGKAEYTAKVVDSWKPAAAIRAVFGTTVTEFSGRGVTDYASRTIDLYPHYIGIKSLQDAGSAYIPGRECRFDIAAVKPDGEASESVSELNVEVVKVRWDSVLRKGSDGYFRYVSEETQSPLQISSLRMKMGLNHFAFTPENSGVYRVYVRDPLSGAAAMKEVRVSQPGVWSYAWSRDTPDELSLAWDKETYQPGDMARLTIKSPFPGRLLASYSARDILKADVYVMTNNTMTLDIPVKEDWYPNIYCNFSLIRAVAPEKIWNPHRAIGRTSLRVADHRKHLSINVEMPDTIRPSSSLSIPISVVNPDGSPASSEITVAAVDEGVLMLSSFKTPDPEAWFGRPRWSTLRHYDLYNHLLPLIKDELGGPTSSPGGGGFGPAARGRLNPVKARRFKTVALWSGSMQTDESGQALVHLDVPEFTGALRVMVVAASKEGKSASYSRQIRVKRPLIVQSSLPRFLAPGDECLMPLRVINESDSVGQINVTVSTSGSLSLVGTSSSDVRRFELDDDQSTTYKLKLSASKNPGLAKVRIHAMMGDEEYAETFELAVRPPFGRSSEFGSGQLDSGMMCSIDLPRNWLQGTERDELWVSGLPSVSMVEGLHYLDRYPYGCLEQTTSCSFPLLYLDDMAELMHSKGESPIDVEQKVYSGIGRLSAMQRADGAFGLWSKSSPAYLWGTMYVVHFLCEAKQAGYEVPDDVLASACQYLERSLKRYVNQASRGGGLSDYDFSYAVYVLSLADRKPLGWIQRLAEKQHKLDMASRVHLAASYLHYGRRKDALKVLSKLEKVPGFQGRDEIGGSLRSSVRDNAILLATWIDADPENAQVALLAEKLDQTRLQGNWYTTQSNGMGLMALGKYCRVLIKNRAETRVQLHWANGGIMHIENPDDQKIDLTSQQTESLRLGNKGEGRVYYGWKSSGVVTSELPAANEGIHLERRILDMAQKPVEHSQYQQGDVYVVHLILTPTEDDLDNVVLQDLLPAGFEIENDRLDTAMRIPWIARARPDKPSHYEMRDDRMLIFTGKISKPQNYYYAVRAVTEGSFTAPGVSAECMYDPTLFARGRSSTVTVKPFAVGLSNDARQAAVR